MKAHKTWAATIIGKKVHRFVFINEQDNPDFIEYSMRKI